MKIKRGVVISGGGAWGAFGAGTLSALNKVYEVGAGISTGALMMPLVLLNDYKTLKDAYCTTKDSDILDLAWYKPKPITKKGKVNKWAIIYALILGNPTFGTSKAMRKHIDKFVTETEYSDLLQQRKEAIVGCQNIAEEPSLVHYFSSKKENFDDFKDWMWLSANYTFATSLVEKEWTNSLGEKIMGQWADGGLTEVIPLKAILDAGCTEIDVIIHRPKPQYSRQISPVKNLIENIERGIKAMRYDIEFENLLETCEHMSKEHGIKITLYFLPRKLGKNSLVFSKKQMTEWWEEGFKTAHDSNRIIIFEPLK